jgi:hypothetical protein
MRIIYEHEAGSTSNTDVNTSLQNCGFSGWNFLYVDLLMPRIWRRLLVFSKICKMLTQTTIITLETYHTLLMFKVLLSIPSITYGMNT